MELNAGDPKRRSLIASPTKWPDESIISPWIVSGTGVDKRIVERFTLSYKKPNSRLTTRLHPECRTTSIPHLHPTFLERCVLGSSRPSAVLIQQTQFPQSRLPKVVFDIFHRLSKSCTAPLACATLEMLH